MVNNSTDRLSIDRVRTLKELGEQYLVWSGENHSFLRKAGFCSGQTVVDLGCGPGFTTIDLAEIVGASGKVIAVDKNDDHSLSLLEEQALSEGIRHIDICAADLLDFQLQEKSVDGVYGRWVCMFLPEKKVSSLVERMRRWLSPGGVCALAEFSHYGDFQVYPHSEYLQIVTKAMREYVSKTYGSNPEIGSILPRIFKKAGFYVETSVVVKVVQSNTSDWIWPDRKFRSILPVLVEKEYLCEEDMLAFLQEWKERSENKDSKFFSSPLVETIAYLEG